MTSVNWSVVYSSRGEMALRQLLRMISMSGTDADGGGCIEASLIHRFPPGGTLSHLDEHNVNIRAAMTSLTSVA